MLAVLFLWACEADKPAEPPRTLIEIAEQGDVTALERLLGEQAQINQRDTCQWTPLMKAALNGHYGSVLKLLQFGAVVDLQDKGGYTAMMLAASNDFADIVELLLKHGANVDHVEQTHGWSALIWAAKRGHRETVRVLVAHQADRQIRDDENRTALDHARLKGYWEVIDLLEKG